MARKTSTYIWDQTPPSDIRPLALQLARREHALTQELARAEAAGEKPQRMSSKTRRLTDIEADLAQVQADLDHLKSGRNDGKIILHLTELSRSAFAKLHIDHPPRPGDETDERMGYNGDTLAPALIRATVTHAEDYTTGEEVPLDLDAWLDEDNDDGLGNADFLALYMAARDLNLVGTDQTPPTRAA